jgi:hypothetical protein
MLQKDPLTKIRSFTGTRASRREDDSDPPDAESFGEKGRTFWIGPEKYIPQTKRRFSSL